MTTPAPAIVVAPNVTTYAAHGSYVTVQEFKDSPTAVQLDNLIIGGTAAQQDQALAVVIERASSWADALTYQVLSATVDTAYTRCRVRANGTILLPLKYKPVIAVLSISVGGRPSTMAPLVDTSNVVIGERGVIEFPASGFIYGYQGAGGVGVGARPLVKATYVNGYPNTVTTTATAAAVTALPVKTQLGVFPGTQLTIYDGPSTEVVTVAPTNVPGSGSLTLTAPTLFAHAAGISVSALPPKVKQAVILLTASLIATSGNDAIALSAMAEPGGLVSEKGASAENIALAMDMLEEFKRVW